MAVSLVSTGVTFPDSSTQTTAATGFGFKNRIINGAMVIDQRNAGASVSISAAANTYTLDRWRANATGGGVYSVQRSTTAPAGFTNSLLATVTTVDSSVGSGDFYHVRQSIEGYNFSDFGFGTASAKQLTISFWVRSSVTGVFTVLLRNEAGNRGYTTTYTINSANTWEQKTVSIPGDTSGTWATDNTSAAIVSFNLGAGNTQTADTWLTTVTEGVTGMAQWISNSGATFYITGVQLEKGSTATSFDYRPYSAELALCQRYYQTSTGYCYIAAKPAGGNTGWAYNSLPVVMRSAGTGTILSVASTIGANWTIDGTSVSTINFGNTSTGEQRQAVTYSLSSEL